MGARCAQHLSFSESCIFFEKRVQKRVQALGDWNVTCIWASTLLYACKKGMGIISCHGLLYAGCWNASKNSADLAHGLVRSGTRHFASKKNRIPAENVAHARSKMRSTLLQNVSYTASKWVLYCLKMAPILPQNGSYAASKWHYAEVAEIVVYKRNW